MGFGSGIFGSGPFGASDWARKALFDSLPEVYRNLDTQNNDLLAKWSEGIGSKFQQFRNKIDSFTDLKDPGSVDTKYNRGTDIKLGRVLDRTGALLQSGINGVIDAAGNFSARSVRFSKADVGRTLSCQALSDASTNTRSFRISGVISPTSVSIQPIPTEISTALSWQVHEKAQAVDYTTVEVHEGDISQIVEGSVLYDGVNEFEIIERSIFPSSESKLFVIDREGNDGLFYEPSDLPGVTVFASPTALFTPTDLGKTISIPGLNALEDMVFYRIDNTVTSSDPALSGFSLVTLTYVSLTAVPQPTDTITPLLNTGQPLYWCIFNRPTITISGTIVPRGILTTLGTSGSVSAFSHTLTDSSRNNFDSSYDGNIAKIYIPKSSSLSDPEELTGVVTCIDSDTLSIASSTWYGSDHSPVHYDLRTPTTLADPALVKVRGPDILSFLAQELGAEFDATEPEARQRALTRHILSWAAQKGQKDSYRAIGDLSGWTTTVNQLYRVDRSTTEGVDVPLASTIRDPDPTLRTSRVNGKADASGWFWDTTSTALAPFTPDMIGMCLEVSGFANPNLNKIYNIIDVNTTTQKLRLSEPGYSTPTSIVDAYATTGVLTWSTFRLYCTHGPEKLVTADAYNVYPDTISNYGAQLSGADKYLWIDGPTKFPTIKVEVIDPIGYIDPDLDGKWKVTVRDVYSVVLEEILPFSIGEIVTGAIDGNTAIFSARSSTRIPPGHPVYLTKASDQFSTFPQTVNGADGGLGIVHFGVMHSPKIIAKYRNWSITDSSGNKFWVEGELQQLPAGPYPEHREFSLDLSSRVSPPTLGLANLDYNAPITPMAGYHSDSVVLLTLSYLDATISKEQFVLRLNEAKPTNVRLILRTEFKEQDSEQESPTDSLNAGFKRTASESESETPSDSILSLFAGSTPVRGNEYREILSLIASDVVDSTKISP